MMFVSLSLQVAENVLYHWKTFPLHLPPPVAVQNDPASTASSGRSRLLPFRVDFLFFGLPLFFTFFLFVPLFLSLLPFFVFFHTILFKVCVYSRSCEPGAPSRLAHA